MGDVEVSYVSGEGRSGSVFGRLTAALLEDSNWYRVNWENVGDWRFGKNEGCEFLYGSCMDPILPESAFPSYFCNNNEGGCSWDGLMANTRCNARHDENCGFE